MLQTYRASGRCGSTFYLATLGLMVLAAAAGAVYQKVVDVVPFIYVNVLLTLGFGFLITVALTKAQALGRCRNAQAALLAGVLVAVAALGGSHFAAFKFWQGEVVDTVRDRIVTGNPKRADVAAIRGADTAAALFPEGATRFDDVHSHLVHQWKECAGCRQGFLDVIVLKYVPNDKGEVKTETEAIRSNVLMDDEVLQAFEAAAATAAAAEKEALTPQEQDPSEPS